MCITTGNSISILTLLQVHRRVLMSLYDHHFYFGLYISLFLWVLCAFVLAEVWLNAIPTPSISRHDVYNMSNITPSTIHVSPYRNDVLRKRKHSMNYETSISFTVFNSVHSRAIAHRVSIDSVWLNYETKSILMGKNRIAC